MTRSNGPIRVAVWGVGMTGTAVVQLIARNPGLELVAGLAYSPDKGGRDVGELAGAGSLGVRVTLDPADLISARPDVVVYVARDQGDWATDNDVLMLLEAGINVVTPLAYHGLTQRGTDVHDRFQSAAMQGGATLMVSGIDPDYCWERQVLTSSGLCAELTGVHVTEIFRADVLGEHVLAMFGFGRSVEQARSDQVFLQFAYNYIAPSMRWACAKMGFALDEVTVKSLSEATDTRIEYQEGAVEPGTVGLSLTRFEGWIDGAVFATHDVKYHFGVNRPPEAPVDECWIVDLEGRPSVRTVVQALASVREGTSRYTDDPNQIAPGYWITAGPLIRAIPVVAAAEPGIKEAAVPEMAFVRPAPVSII